VQDGERQLLAGLVALEDFDGAFAQKIHAVALVVLVEERGARSKSQARIRLER
jgi:hypothetical protein